MSIIRKYTTAKGDTRYRVEIRLKRDGRIIHSESRSFTKPALAKAFQKKRDFELAQGVGLSTQKANDKTLREILDWYYNEHSPSWKRTKRATIRMIMEFAVTETRLSELTAAVLIEHIKWRRKDCGASTANNDLVWMRVAMKSARPVFPNYPINLDAFDDAAQYCRDHKLISKSGKRDRRPTQKELDILTDYFGRRDTRSAIPMVDIMWYAIHSARREAEICALLWKDVDEDHSMGKLYALKDPRKQAGNDKHFKMTAKAMEIVLRQPKGERVFPYEAKSVSAAFTRATRACGIDDLRFHDLRHEATSRLFEAGYAIIEVQQFTLHESWATLKRYTNLSPKTLVLR